MGKATADSAAVAHRPVGYGPGDSLQGPAGEIGHPAVLDVGMGDAGSEHEGVVLDPGLPEFGHTGDVEDQIRLDKAQVQHRPEGLATRH